ELLSHVVQLTRHVVDYRTFGLLLLNDETQELEIKVSVQFGEKVNLPKVPLGEGLVGYAAFHREAVLVPDVSKDPRYIKVVEDVRAEVGGARAGEATRARAARRPWSPTSRRPRSTSGWWGGCGRGWRCRCWKSPAASPPPAPTA